MSETSPSLAGQLGEALEDDEREAFTAVTGREREPLERVDEFWNIVGRRGGNPCRVSCRVELPRIS
jgi:hypothetical protein